MALLVGAAACALSGRADPRRAPVRIGTGPEREQLLLATIVAELLKAEGMATEIASFEQSRDARQAIELGEVDVLPSYSGAVGIDEMGWSSPEGDPATSFDRVKRTDERDGLIWLGPSQANASFAFVVAVDGAGAPRFPTLSQLASHVSDEPSARLCVDREFAGRPDGLEALARVYSLPNRILVSQIVAASPGEAVAAVGRGNCVAGLVSATDGQAWAAGLRAVQDDLKAFPAFVVAPVVTQQLRESRPEAVGALVPFEALTTAHLAELNARVMLGASVQSVAADAAQQLRQLRPVPAANRPRTKAG